MKTPFKNNSIPTAWACALMTVEVARQAGANSRVLVNGHTAFSFGPCVVNKDGEVRRPMDHEATSFYGLYVHDSEGIATCVGDADDESSIKELLNQTAGTWLVSYARHIVADLASVAQALEDIDKALRADVGDVTPALLSA